MFDIPLQIIIMFSFIRPNQRSVPVWYSIPGFHNWTHLLGWIWIIQDMTYTSTLPRFFNMPLNSLMFFTIKFTLKSSINEHTTFKMYKSYSTWNLKDPPPLFFKLVMRLHKLAPNLQWGYKSNLSSSCKWRINVILAEFTVNIWYDWH